MSDKEDANLEAALKRFNQRITGIPFHAIIKAICGGAQIIPADRQRPAHAKALEKIEAAARKACQDVAANPISRPRPNEVGNDMEPFLIAALAEQGISAGAPVTRSGKGKSTGYPDIRAAVDGLIIHIEVKTYAAANKDTTQRSFYFSPSEDAKVHEDGLHILVGFEIEDRGSNGNKDSRNRELRNYHAVAYSITDLYDLACDMKFEFNSDNRRLYGTSKMLATGRL